MWYVFIISKTFSKYYHKIRIFWGIVVYNMSEKKLYSVEIIDYRNNYPFCIALSFN